MKFLLVLKLAVHSLKHRRLTVSLVILSVAFSVALLLGIDRLRADTRDSFTNTLSGTSLIVGARTGSLNLLLYSVFRIGDATNNISWQSYQELAQRPEIDWTVPLSLGDAHHGFRVLGTNNDYFSHYQYADHQALQLTQGRLFETDGDVVLGSQVADALGYKTGDEIIVSHGLVDTDFNKHQNHPFKVVGILAATGTPVDKTVHVPLGGITAMHRGYFAPTPGTDPATAITAFLVGLKSPIQTFSVQRAINEYRAEPLLAIIPGVTLQQLWQLMSLAENAFYAISLAMIAVGLFGLMTMLLTGMNERRREMAILRALGARPWQLFLLLMLESGLIGLLALITGAVFLVFFVVATAPVMQSQFGIQVHISWPSLLVTKALAGYCLIALVLGLIPGWKAYRQSLADGLTVKI
jgi:putative ABC transport system permease protein